MIMAASGASTHNICIYTLNVADGVGDAVCAIKTAQELYKLHQEHQLPITAIIELQAGSPYNTIINILRDKIPPLESIFLLSDDPELDDTKLPPGVVKVSRKDFKQSSALTNTLSKCDLYIDIYNRDCEPKCGGIFDNYLSSSTPRIRLSELGVPLPNDEASTGYNLGMDYDGIWIDSYDYEDIESRAQKLLNFNNKEYVEMLLNKKGPTLADAIDYLENHRLMPGYLQNEYQMLFFIVTMILKNCDKNGKLSHACDFHVGKGVKPELLIKAMNDLGLNSNQLHFVNPESNSKKSISDEPKIRIISNYILDEHDFKSLYTLSKDGAACSGDNSFQDAMSSHHPVFIAGYGLNGSPTPGQNQFIKEFATGSFKYKLLDYLDAYAEEMFACSVLPCMSPMLRPRNQENEYQTILNQAKSLSRTMQQSDFANKWETFRADIHQSHNFTERFPGIICNALKIYEPRDSSHKRNKP
jgi:hypothetical protein